MSEMRTSVFIDLAGNIAQRAQQFGRALKGMTDIGSRNLAVLQLSVRKTAQVIDGMGNRYTALATGGAAAAATRNVVDMDKSIRALGISSGKTAQEMEVIQKQLLATAQMSHVRVDFQELEASVANIVELTGDLDFALANRETMGMTISATGASGEAVGGLFAEFNKSGFDATQVSNAVGVLIQQGKEGAFTMQNLAAMGPRVVSAYATSGRQGAQSYKEMGAALQVIRMSAGSSEQAATTFEALMRSFNDIETLKRLKQVGIKVYDEEQLKKGVKQLRPINELMTEIVTKSKADTTKIGTVFTDSEAARSFNTLIAEFKRTGKTEIFDKFMNMQGDSKALLDDSQRMADSYASLMKNLSNAWMEFSTKNLGGPIEDLAKGLRSLTQEDVQRWMDMGKSIVYVGASIIAVRKAWQAGAAIKQGIDWYRNFNQNKAGTSKGGAAGGLGALSGRGGAVPVYLVDGPMSTIPERSKTDTTPGGAAGEAVKKTIKERVQNAKAVGVNTLKGGAPLAVVGGLVETASVLASDAPIGQKVVGVGGAVGGATGAWAGAALGAAAGSFIPIIGTAIGAMLGGALGYASGEWLGKETGQVINSALDLKVTVDGPPGTTAKVGNMKATGTELDADVYYNGGGMIGP